MQFAREKLNKNIDNPEDLNKPKTDIHLKLSNFIALAFLRLSYERRQ